MNIQALALQSLLFEVSCSPKPGLVDRFGNGAHSDMNFYSFMTSTALLSGYFDICVKTGHAFAEKNLPIDTIIEELREFAIDAEKLMYEHSKANTHKGAIFIMGLLTSITAYLSNGYQKITAEEICKYVAVSTKDIVSKELNKDVLAQKKVLTNGERLFLKYGVKGIRGEVQSGLNTICKFSLPVLKEVYKKNISTDAKLIYILLNIMMVNQDTNVLSRHGLQTLGFMHDYSKKIIDKFPLDILAENEDKFINEIIDMDDIFVKKNISPGGSADLLAATIFLGSIEGF